MLRLRVSCLLWLVAASLSGSSDSASSNTTESATLTVSGIKENDESFTESYNKSTTESNEDTTTKNKVVIINATTETFEETTKTQDNITSNVPVETTENVPTKFHDLATTPQNIETTSESGFIDILAVYDEEGETNTTLISSTTTTIPSPIETATNKTRRETLSDQIRSVISHYKKHGTVFVPDASVPDPMSLPNMKNSLGGMDMTFTNQKVYGLSNYTIEHVNTDLNKMQVYVAVYIRRMIILGNYSANVWFRKVAGPFNVTLLYVEASGAAALVRDAEGNLQASDSEMDMTFMDSKVNFGNMGLMGSLLQGAAATAGPVLFEAVKPIILKEIHEKVRDDINKKIKKIGSRFNETGTTPPLDLAIQEARNYVKENGYDPFQVNNYALKYMPTNGSLFRVNISQLTLTGLSDFRRVGDVSLSMDSGTIQLGLHLATSKLKGRCKWSFSIGKSFQRIGHTNFTIDYVQGRGIINQSLDVSQHPELEDIDINVGKVRVQVKGTGPFDVLVEAIVNTLPDLIRHIVVDAIELPLKFAIQHILSEINVEEVLEKRLPELDKMGL